MMMVPNDPAARDFAIECLLDDLSSGRVDRDEIDELRAELRILGDVGRLERVARAVDARS